MEVTQEMIFSADRFIVYFSGGKDSIALVLFLLDSGVSKDKIELWHHEIDGRQEEFMDWRVTKPYVQSFADAFGIRIFYSYKQGGFKGELLRENSLTSPTVFEDENKALVTVGGKRGKIATRRKFPQVTADLKTRWCSAYLKIGVAEMAILNQERFRHSTTVVLSGERGEESAARAKYNIMELDRADGSTTKHKRVVYRFRPILTWKEKQVWDIIEKYKVRVHPAYYLGFSRCSCLYCVFANASQLASAYRVAPNQGDQIIAYEKEFGFSIKRDVYMDDLIAMGEPYEGTNDMALIALARSDKYTRSIIMNDDEFWELPSGAYGDGCGPQ